MKKSEIKKEAVLNKFEKNVLKAEALQDIGRIVESNIESEERELQSSKDYLDEKFRDLMADFADVDEDGYVDDWTVYSRLDYARRDYEVKKTRLALWKKVEAVLEKELS